MEKFTDTFAIIFRPLCLMAATFALAFLIGGIAQCVANARKKYLATFNRYLRK